MAEANAADKAPKSEWERGRATPESEGFVSARLDALWETLKSRDTHALLVIRRDRIVFERYADGYSRATPHGTASLAKALVGGTSLMLAMSDHRISPDDFAWKHVPEWKNDPQKRKITVAHLATHTSGIEDAEKDGLPHDKLPGWKGEFWRQLPPPRDPFTLSRDVAPVMEESGTKERYSNPGMAMLGYCITASLKGAPQENLRSLLRERVLRPLGVPEKEATFGYGKTVEVGGLKLVATWGGGSFSPNATARVGRLMLRHGDWDGEPIIASNVCRTATTWAKLPNASGLGWWVNRDPGGGRVWNAVPDDAFWGSGAGHQILFVVPSLDLVVVRNGSVLDPDLEHRKALEVHLIAPLMEAFSQKSAASAATSSPAPPSPVLGEIRWEPPETILRQAQDSDCWPLTWADDDALYTAYGDGYGFDPKVPEKLSLGLARITGSPPHFHGENVRSSTLEQKGNGPAGKKASGLLMVEGVLYLWARNAGNSQLAWSGDRGKTWEWADWRFTESFGCPTFLNFGKNYTGARDGYVYIYSPDAEDAYTPADRMVLARVSKGRLRDRNTYQFFVKIDTEGTPAWTHDISQRGAVFTNPGRCYRSGITYNPGVKRYLWVQTLAPKELRHDGKHGDLRFEGGLAVFDAPEPWGPWTTVSYEERWDVGPGETASFPSKWMSEDGKTLYLVSSTEDYFSVRKATLMTKR